MHSIKSTRAGACCIVIGCANSHHNPTVKYYPVPTSNPNICKQWYINTLREDLTPSGDHHVCVEHFDEESFVTPATSNTLTLSQHELTLKDDAVPSLFEIEVFQKMISHQEAISANRPGGPIPTFNFQAITEQLSAAQTHTKCSIPSCQSTTDDLFTLPKQTDLAQKWLSATRLTDPSAKICRKHFTPTDFNEYNYLKADAVPSQNLHPAKNTLTQSLSSSKRSRIDPDQRAELIARVPKAVKRTSAITGPKPQMSAAQLLSTTHPAKPASTRKSSSSVSSNMPSYIPPPIPNTQPGVSIAQLTQSSSSRFLSAALNSSPTVSMPISASTNVIKSIAETSPSARSTTSINSTANLSSKGQKAVKHTSANMLLKEILPPPIMQSTKRTAKAVKHTGGLSYGLMNTQTASASSSIKLTVAAPPPKNAGLQPLQQNNSIVNQHQMELNNNGNGNNSNVTSANINTHKTTYVYKKISNAPEIELQLECEDDEELIESELRESASSQNNSNKKESNLAPENLKKSAAGDGNKSMKMLNKLVSETATTATPAAHDAKIAQKRKLNDYGPSVGVGVGKQANASQRGNEVERALINTVLKYYSRKEASKDLKLSENGDDKEEMYAAKCNICESVLPNNIELSTHICSHLEGSNYISPFDAVTTTCSVCDTEHTNPYELIRHLDLEHMKQLGEFKCRICERQHHNLKELIAHLSAAHVHNEMPYNCDACSFRTSFYADAIYHIKKEHINTKRHFCPYCLTSIELKMDEKNEHVVVDGFYEHLITHFNKHEDNDFIPSRCKHCRKCILHVRHMKEHLQKDHATNNNSNNNVKLQNNSSVSMNNSSLNSSSSNSSQVSLNVSAADIEIANDHEGSSVLLKKSSKEAVDLLPSTITFLDSSQVQSASENDTNDDTDFIFNANTDSRRVQKAVKSTSAINSILRQHGKFGDMKRRRPGRPVGHSNKDKSSKDLDQFEKFVSDEDEEEDFNSSLKLNNFKFYYGDYLNKSKCLECGENDLLNHYRTSYVCHQCRYGTFCANAFEYHLHKHVIKKRQALWNKSIKDEYSYRCACNHESHDGNQMAEHQLNCMFKSCQAYQANKQNAEIQAESETVIFDDTMISHF